jgi:hypothetical protein
VKGIGELSSRAGAPSILCKRSKCNWQAPQRSQPANRTISATVQPERQLSVSLSRLGRRRPLFYFIFGFGPPSSIFV